MRVLAGDIGGTKTLLQLAEVDPADPRQLVVLAEQRYASAEYDDLLPIVQNFLGETGIRHPGQVDSACFAVAGPVFKRAGIHHAKITNLPWELHGGMLAQGAGLGRVALINDFEAVGYGIEALTAEGFAPLQAGSPDEDGPRVVLGAGTGLGVCQMVRDSLGYRVIPSEGGHSDFAPADDEQMGLLSFLRQRYSHVSYDRILSGPGLLHIFSYLVEKHGAAGEPTVKDILTQRDPPAAISAAALESHRLACGAMEIFVRIYGAQAGNLALTTLATGGVYLAGGIAPKIISELRKPAFLEAFRAKGRMAELMIRIPVAAVMNPNVGVLGAAVAALRFARI